MKQSRAEINGISLRFYSYNTIVVGSGAAGFGAAGYLHQFGQKDVAIITEGINMGTSRNTGSDKQTYYRLTLSGEEADSVKKMADTLFQGGSMDGDIAMCEAACSARCFFRLLELGVPFPHNSYGEYVGYKTDHDPCKRGTSVGPLTSKYMTECLERDVLEKGIPIYDGYQVIEILTANEGEKTRTVGLVALDLKQIESEPERYAIFLATNIVYATGGEAGMYQTSVYPISQTGGTGTALRAGVMAKNLTESQYGIASVKFRWNLSGSYQQVIPRYVSTDINGGDEKEFLDEAFNSPGSMLDAIFLKGYQWPFDPRKLESSGSSAVDLMVYTETVVKGRRVWIDFRRNPSKMDFSLLADETFEYLKNCGATQDTPYKRLVCMNQPAAELYLNNGIDLSSEMLEVAVCAQHNNGGLSGDIWWESNLEHFFPVGEVNGTHGVYRPGGSALNSGQVGGLRASQYIAANYSEPPLIPENLPASSHKQIECSVALGQAWLKRERQTDPIVTRKDMGIDMSGCGAAVRSLENVRKGLARAKDRLKALCLEEGNVFARNLPGLFRNRDLLISQITYLSAIEDYILNGGGSRGSYLIRCEDRAEKDFRPLDLSGYRFGGSPISGMVQEVIYREEHCEISWRDVHPLPDSSQWFESVWKDYMMGNITK